MAKKAGLPRFERELERALATGWAELGAAGLLSEVLAYGVISPDGMESVEPFVFMRSDAAQVLKDWGAEPGTDLRGALGFPPVVHQGALLEESFRSVAEAYERIEIDEQAALENEARSLIEAVVGGGPGDAAVGRGLRFSSAVARDGGGVGSHPNFGYGNGSHRSRVAGASRTGPGAGFFARREDTVFRNPRGRAARSGSG